MAKPNITKKDIVDRLTVIKNSCIVVGESGIANDIDDLINGIKKDLA